MKQKLKTKFVMFTVTSRMIILLSVLKVFFIHSKDMTYAPIRFVIFNPLKSPVELNSLLSEFFCYTTCFVIPPH